MPSKNGGLAMYVEAGVPGVPVALGDRQRAPPVVALEHDAYVSRNSAASTASRDRPRGPRRAPARCRRA